MKKKYISKIILFCCIIFLFVISTIPCVSINLKTNIYKMSNNDFISNTQKLKIVTSAPKIESIGNYITVNIKEAESYLLNPGKPVLPKLVNVFRFPLGTRIIDIKLKLKLIEQIPISKKIIPAPEPILGNLNIKTQRNKINENIYESSKEYPKEWFYYKTGGGLEDGKHFTFLSIHLYPIKYLPSQNILKYARELELIVEYEEPVNQYIFPEEYDLLIISPSDFSDDIQPLIHHKNNYNISSKFVSLEEINGQGRDKQEKIKYFIKDSIENWGIKYVLLVGDKTKIPVRYAYTTSFNILYAILIGKVPTDLYYADIYNAEGDFCSWDTDNNGKFGEIRFSHTDKVDLYPDVALGRLYCKNSEQVTDIVDKIISYETITHGQDWFNNIVLCGGNTHSDWKDRFFINYPSFSDILGDGTPAYEGEYIGDKISEILDNFNSDKIYASSFIPLIVRNGKKLTTENINTAINNGAGFVFFIGHGDPNTWITYLPIFSSIRVPFPNGYGVEQIKHLNNENKYPIIIFDACSCGDIKNVKSPIAWEIMRHKTKGSIACFATTSLSFGYPGTWSEKGFNNLVNLGISMAVKDNQDKVGNLLKYSINNYLNTVDFNNFLYPINVYVLQISELFGDPTLKIGGYQ